MPPLGAATCECESVVPAALVVSPISPPFPPLCCRYRFWVLVFTVALVALSCLDLKEQAALQVTMTALRAVLILLVSRHSSADARRPHHKLALLVLRVIDGDDRVHVACNRSRPVWQCFARLSRGCICVCFLSAYGYGSEESSSPHRTVTSPLPCVCVSPQGCRCSLAWLCTRSSSTLLCRCWLSRCGTRRRS